MENTNIPFKAQQISIVLSLNNNRIYHPNTKTNVVDYNSEIQTLLRAKVEAKIVDMLKMFPLYNSCQIYLHLPALGMRSKYITLGAIMLFIIKKGPKLMA